MPTWAIVLIVIGSVLILEIIIFCIIHRHLLKSIFNHGPKMKAPRWHFWIPKKNRIQ